MVTQLKEQNDENEEKMSVISARLRDTEMAIKAVTNKVLSLQKSNDILTSQAVTHKDQIAVKEN